MIALTLASYLLGAGMVFGNGLTIMAVFRFEKLRTRANMYVVSLAATDALVGVLLFVVGSFNIASVSPFFNSSQFVCMGMYSWGYCTTVCSGLNMCLISLDRYIYIAKPFTYEQFVTEKKIGIAIFFAWVIAFTYGTVPLYYNHFQSVKVCSMTEVVPTVFRSFTCTSIFAFCCVFTSVFYIRISILTFRHRRQIAQCQGQLTKEISSKVRLTRGSLKVLKLFVLVFGLLFVCWSPYFTFDFITEFTADVDALVYNVLLMFGFLNSGLNVFVYSYYNKDFRSAMKTLLCCCGKSSKSHLTHVRSVTEWTA